MMRSGLIGRAILASRSPWLHEQEARAQGLALDYTLHDFSALGYSDDVLGPLTAALASEGYAGFNVTYPFKQQIMPLLDTLDESAEAVGAVNTVAIREGRLHGYNTDMAGFRQSVTETLGDVVGTRVLQIGAGGAGAAVACALLSLGVARLSVADVDAGRAEQLAARLRQRFGGASVAADTVDAMTTDGVDGIVNATPVGLTTNPGLPLDAALIQSHHWVADIVYFPLETSLLRTARAKGCDTLDGSGMVVNQAAAAFQIITEHAADRDRMRSSFFAMPGSAANALAS